MYFYCTSKIKNYHKVGIASSLDRVKKRLTTYRSSNPSAKIKFFSDIGSKDSDIEWSYKNKFGGFRIGKSECYKLDFDIIYKHFLKFQHKHNKLHHFWQGSIYYLSEYYLDKTLYDFDVCDFTEGQLRDTVYGHCYGFIPIARIHVTKEEDKEGYCNFQSRILDIKKINLKEYRNKYSKFCKEKFFGKPYLSIANEFNKFCDENFTLKKNYKAQQSSSLYYTVGDIIFKMFQKKHGSLLKKYPKDPLGCAYWEKPEQKSITRYYKNFKFRKRVISNFSGKYDLDEVMESISSSIPRKNSKVVLQTFRRILDRFNIRASRENRKFFDDIEKKLNQELKIIEKNEKIELEINNQNEYPKKRRKYLKLIK